MLQSCETLVTKINEWQKAILELEKLSDEFLNTSDKSLKAEIENKKQEIVSHEKEYQTLAYPELPNGEKLFWPEKEMLEEIKEKIGLDDNKFRVKNNHLVGFDLSHINLSQFSIDFSLFHNLEVFRAYYCRLKKLPYLPITIKELWINGNLGIEIPDDLTNLNNLEEFNASACQFKKLPKLLQSIKRIIIQANNLSDEEKNRIIEEYPNAEIYF